MNEYEEAEFERVVKKLEYYEKVVDPQLRTMQKRSEFIDQSLRRILPRVERLEEDVEKLSKDIVTFAESVGFQAPFEEDTAAERTAYYALRWLEVKYSSDGPDLKGEDK